MRESCRHHIPISKLKCALYLVFFGFVGLSGPYAIHAVFIKGNPLRSLNVVWLFLCPLTLPICMTALCSLGRKLFNPKGGLTITAEGIFNDSSPFSNHYLSWSEVDSIHLKPNVIELHANRVEGFTTLPRGWMKSKRRRTKINITTDCLQATYEEIVLALRTHQPRPIVDER